MKREWGSSRWLESRSTLLTIRFHVVIVTPSKLSWCGVVGVNRTLNNENYFRTLRFPDTAYAGQILKALLPAMRYVPNPLLSNVNISSTSISSARTTSVASAKIHRNILIFFHYLCRPRKTFFWLRYKTCTPWPKKLCCLSRGYFLDDSFVL